MSTITKERVAGIARGEKCYTHDDVVKLARIALASLEAEPVAWTNQRSLDVRDKITAFTCKESADIYGEKSAWSNIVPLYSAHPAPVSVPDEQHSERFNWTLGQWAEHVGGHYKGNDPANYYEFGSFMAVAAMLGQFGTVQQKLGWNACRAAMLQGAEPVTTTSGYKLRDAVDAIRNSGIEIDAEKIFAERDALNAPDCWCRTCRPITLTDMRFVVCPDCGNKRCPHANDHRNVCTGSDEPGQEGSAYPAAPQQEVKL